MCGVYIYIIHLNLMVIYDYPQVTPTNTNKSKYVKQKYIVWVKNYRFFFYVKNH